MMRKTPVDAASTGSRAIETIRFRLTPTVYVREVRNLTPRPDLQAFEPIGRDGIGLFVLAPAEQRNGNRPRARNREKRERAWLRNLYWWDVGGEAWIEHE